MRVAHHINLVDAAKEITNKSTLAEWEKGKDNLSWRKVIALLFNIHVQPMEFLENTVSSHLYFSIQEFSAKEAIVCFQQLIKKKQVLIFEELWI